MLVFVFFFFWGGAEPCLAVVLRTKILQVDGFDSIRNRLEGWHLSKQRQLSRNFDPKEANKGTLTLNIVP